MQIALFRKKFMPAFIDLTGQQINYWTVISRSNNEGTSTCWYCRCSCGTERVVRAAHLSTGASKSCGCAPYVISTHGEARGGNNSEFSKKYRTWRSIRDRCLNENHKNADIYNGLLCNEWQDFNNFNRDVSEPNDNSLTIDRIDNSKGYEPGNVRWATMTEQHRNQNNCRPIEFNGKTQLLTDWAKEIGIEPSALSVRIKNHGIEKAITTPNNKNIAPASNRFNLTKNGITDTLGGWQKRLKVGYVKITQLIKDGYFE